MEWYKELLRVRSLLLFEPNSDSLALVDPILGSQRSQTTSMLAGAFTSNTLSESPSSEEEDSLEEGEDEEQSTELVLSMITGISDDGKILAHNRKWESCSDVFVDPATLQRKRKTFFRWPLTLQLGDKSFSNAQLLKEISFAILVSDLQWQSSHDMDRYERIGRKRFKTVSQTQRQISVSAFV
ncbi:Hypothetical protein PHPALM_36131 [Phytophthora palmivora]|uniref:Uncharacterized protein n=1 Tax=Phytophthora palmivora TaxID=4796 RepID=A0A2P4X0R3_9STRA|nr:Hypothetical protein PHPALM_36131 [Phytophthora palmivora]